MIEHRGMEAHANVNWPGHAVDFYVGFKDTEGRRRVLQSGKGYLYQDVAAGVFLEPSFSLDRDAAQAFFEEMWAQGFRSVHDKGNTDKLDAARKEHIEDLRKVAKIA